MYVAWWRRRTGFIYTRPLPGIGAWIKFSPKKNWKHYKGLFHSKTWSENKQITHSDNAIHIKYRST